VVNLKAARLAGFESHGMLLAASHGGDGGRVELVEVPEGAAVGERVGLEGHVDMCAFAPLAPAQVKKKKAWEAVASKLKTSAEGIVTFDEHALVTSKGKCFAPTIRSGIVR
jgi:tRNA-binding EMAP/Myf-like protein